MDDITENQLVQLSTDVQDIYNLQYSKENFELIKSMLIFKIQLEESQHKFANTQKLVNSSIGIAQDNNEQQNGGDYAETLQKQMEGAQARSIMLQSRAQNDQIESLLGQLGFIQTKDETSLQCIRRCVLELQKQLEKCRMQLQELMLDYTELKYQYAISDTVSKIVERIQ